jgi:hypothetical protein
MAEFNARYNKHIDPEELAVWRVTRWDGSIDTPYDYIEEHLKSLGKYVKAVDGKWYHTVNFASGNIYEKLDSLEKGKARLTEDEYGRQKALLENVLPEPKTVAGFEVSPLSDFARKFETGGTWKHSDEFLQHLAGVTRKKEKVRKGEGEIKEGGRISLTEAFKRWIDNTNEDELGLNANTTKEDVLNYVNKTRAVSVRGYTQEEKESNKAEAARVISARRGGRGAAVQPVYQRAVIYRRPEAPCRQVQPAIQRHGSAGLFQNTDSS